MENMYIKNFLKQHLHLVYFFLIKMIFHQITYNIYIIITASSHNDFTIYIVKPLL